MGERTVETPAGRLRRRGVRVSAGPWTLCGETPPGGRGKLIVALGKAAGGATTRSRIRRIARGVFAETGGRPAGTDLLLLARSDVSHLPRRLIRETLVSLWTRLAILLARREAAGRPHA